MFFKIVARLAKVGRDLLRRGRSENRRRYSESWEAPRKTHHRAMDNLLLLLKIEVKGQE